MSSAFRTGQGFLHTSTPARRACAFTPGPSLAQQLPEDTGAQLQDTLLRHKGVWGPLLVTQAPKYFSQDLGVGNPAQSSLRPKTQNI